MTSFLLKFVTFPTFAVTNTACSWPQPTQAQSSLPLLCLCQLSWQWLGLLAPLTSYAFYLGLWYQHTFTVCLCVVQCAPSVGMATVPVVVTWLLVQGQVTVWLWLDMGRQVLSLARWSPIPRTGNHLSY